MKAFSPPLTTFHSILDYPCKNILKSQTQERKQSRSDLETGSPDFSHSLPPLHLKKEIRTIRE